MSYTIMNVYGVCCFRHLDGVWRPYVGAGTILGMKDCVKRCSSSAEVRCTSNESRSRLTKSTQF